MPLSQVEYAKRWATFTRGGIFSAFEEEPTMLAIAPTLPAYRPQPDSKRKNHPPQRKTKKRTKPQKGKREPQRDEDR